MMMTMMKMMMIIIIIIMLLVGLDSSVGIATRHTQDGLGIEHRWRDEIFCTRPHRSWGHPSLLHNEYRVIYRARAVAA
jgi:hypothetical protein